MCSAPPSTYLPGLVPVPPPSTILDSLFRLAAAYATPPSALVDLRHSVYAYATPSAAADEVTEGEDGAGDAFELGFARGWLENVLATGSRALARGMDETGEWEQAVDGAARLLADLSGPSAQGSTTKTYLLPDPLAALTPPAPFPYPTPPPTRPSSTAPFLPRLSHSTAVSGAPADASASPLRLTVRDGTLLEASTGHRTWGSASILAHLLAASPSRFFPALCASPPAPSPPLRILELGSGTGLVGLTAAAVLSRLGVGARGGAEVVLSDGGDEPQAVLDNLLENVVANEGAMGDGVRVRVERLDWRDYLLESTPTEVSPTPRANERFDILLGTDLVYERGQATLLHAAAAGLLRFPSSFSTATSRPTFWLALPIRPTHADENAEVAELFPSPASSWSAASASALCRTDPATGKAYRLAAVEREELLGPSGFATGRTGRGGVAAMGELRYCVRRIEWEEVPWEGSSGEEGMGSGACC
ncbi:hypothetical protein JCM9279_007637 [Rhodotorula babjevae]